ncbi:MAG: hypothetical protein ABR562_06130, partial [Thermoplasmatota archaeon]|nr:hypothetical protein [Halobacteriales archaeon]
MATVVKVANLWSCLAVGAALLAVASPVEGHVGFGAGAFSPGGSLEAENYDTVDLANCDPDFNSEHTWPNPEPTASNGQIAFLPHETCWIHFNAVTFPGGSQILGARGLITGTNGFRELNVQVLVDGIQVSSGTLSMVVPSPLQDFALTPT